MISLCIACFAAGASFVALTVALLEMRDYKRISEHLRGKK